MSILIQFCSTIPIKYKRIIQILKIFLLEDRNSLLKFVLQWVQTFEHRISNYTEYKR